METREWHRIFPNLVAIVILVAALFTAQFLSFPYTLKTLIAEQPAERGLIVNGQTALDSQFTPGRSGNLVSVKESPASTGLADNRIPSTVVILFCSGLIALIGLNREKKHPQEEK